MNAREMILRELQAD